MSVPAQEASEHPTHPRITTAGNAAVQPVAVSVRGLRDAALTDRNARVLSLFALAYPTAEVDVPTLTTLLPLSEQQVGNAVGDLVRAGYLTKRMAVVGYRDSSEARVRRYLYSLAGVR